VALPAAVKRQSWEHPGWGPDNRWVNIGGSTLGSTEAASGSFMAASPPAEWWIQHFTRQRW
jgi:hypothetical protein